MAAEALSPDPDCCIAGGVTATGVDVPERLRGAGRGGGGGGGMKLPLDAGRDRDP